MCIHVPSIDELGCGENEPGVETIHLISDNDLVFPLPVVDSGTHTISTDLGLVDQAVAGFENWKFLEDNCHHEENANDNGQYDHLIELKIPKDDPVKRHTFSQMNSRCCRWSAIYTDKNGMTKLVTGLKFKDNYTTGKGGENNDNNEYIVRFTKTGIKGYHYTGVIPVKV